MPTVFITGANRGLGLEFTRQYAADGWRVIATCRDPDKADGLKALDGDIRIYAMDVTDAVSVAAAGQALGGEAIDLLINNAGVYGPRDMGGDDMDYDAWAGVLAINAMAPLRVATAFKDNVQASDLKTIITISSLLGSIDNAGVGKDYIYRSSKAAVNMVMKTLSANLESEGLCVVMLHPGWVQTDMGGAEATVTPEDSIAGMRSVIAGLTMADNGKFFTYDGSAMAW